MKKNYFFIIAPEIFFMIIDSLFFDSRWELLNFALTCRLFYTHIKKQTKNNDLSKKKNYILKDINKKIKHTILFEKFKTFHITVKKSVYGLINCYEKKKYENIL